LCSLDRADPKLGELTGLLQEQTEGSMNGTDPRSKRPARFVFVKLPSSLWTFVAVIPAAAR
jgi:hypothetical protein